MIEGNYIVKTNMSGQSLAYNFTLSNACKLLSSSNGIMT